MSEPRAGETIKMTLQHLDENDKVMMDLAVNWYGFNNEMANEQVLGMVDALNSKMREFSAQKNK